MTHTHLTNSYRPQTFSQVVGQEQIRKILSRAAEEAKIAPAYMMSGTRGVGKTTIARIFAKAINCQNGPAAEPCNVCRICQQITRNTCLDVSEIDGASHTGVDHVRKLNEEVEYAPLECRYKVIIIDEAHMLSRSAFNALLKTLEEPPAHAVFILATTEPHKFPATIVSRCQHYAFKRLSEKELEDYMASILLKEQIGYEPEALRLVARKGSGSVRDSLSILSQLLTLGESSIHLEAVREILGVIGHETMQGLMEAFSSQETKSLILLVRDLFTKGLDIGFFLQELAMAWRNMFLLKQTGEQGLSLLEVPLEEAEHWHRWSRYFSLSYIHAAWQLTLEGQRRVVMSIDPSTSLELLLLNIAFLPDLLPIETLSKEQISISDHPPRSTSNMNGQKKEQTDSGSEATGTRKEEQEFPNHRKATDERGYLAECCQTHSKTWDGFLQFLREEKNGVHLPNLQCVRSVFQQDRLELYCPNFLCERLQDETRYQTLKEKIQKYFDQVNEVCVYYDASEEKPSYQELKKKVMAKPLVQEVMNEFKAKIVDIKPREPREGDEQ